jgi:acyl carrier protein
MNPHQQLINDTLIDLFDLAPERLVPTARLYEDLGLDSIDAIDLIVKLSEYSGRKLSGEEFKKVRTLQDLYTVVETVLAQSAA